MKADDPTPNPDIPQTASSASWPIKTGSRNEGDAVTYYQIDTRVIAAVLDELERAKCPRVEFREDMDAMRKSAGELRLKSVCGALDMLKSAINP